MVVQYEERSKRSGAGIALVSAFIAVAVVALGYSLWRYSQLGSAALAEILIEAIILFVLVSQAVGTYTFKLTESNLIIDEVGLLGKKRMVIPYTMINGVYQFKQSMMPPLKFRYKYRKLSSTDDRPVWALAYSVVEGKKLKHGTEPSAGKRRPSRFSCVSTRRCFQTWRRLCHLCNQCIRTTGAKGKGSINFFLEKRIFQNRGEYIQIDNRMTDMLAIRHTLRSVACCRL